MRGQETTVLLRDCQELNSICEPVVLHISRPLTSLSSKSLDPNMSCTKIVLGIKMYFV
jgi:hypothetical protein